MDSLLSRCGLEKHAILVLLEIFPVASGCVAAAAPPTHPYGQSESFKLLKDWTFGRNRPDATIRTRRDLDQNFYYRYIFANGTLDGISTYWSYHRDYPDGDRRHLPRFTDTPLIRKGPITRN